MKKRRGVVLMMLAALALTTMIGFVKIARAEMGSLQVMFWRGFVAIPLALMDFCLMSREDPMQEAHRVMDLAERERAVLVLNWHLRVFSDREYPGWGAAYEALIAECHRRGARFRRMADVATEAIQTRGPGLT